MTQRIMKVLIIGLGEIGTAITALLEDQPHIILQTRDIPETRIKLPIDVMHICFPYEPLFEDHVFAYMIRYKPKLTLIESTVLPKTTKSLYEATRMAICHSPIRGRHTENLTGNLRNYTKFIGTDKPKFGRIAEKYYQSLGLKTYVCQNSITTELTKLLSTSYYGLLIAWFQEIRRICKKFNANENTIRYWFLTSTLESTFQHMRPIFYPSHIKGHCIIPNLQLLNSVYPSKFVDAILDSNRKTKGDT